MSQLRRIVVGHNLRPDGELALRSAMALAERSNAALHLVHVVEPYPVYQRMRFPAVPADTVREEGLLKLQAQLKDVATSPQLSSFRVETNIRFGKPFVELIGTCRSWHGDLIVIGVSPHAQERFLGSTSERVLRKALVPVLISKQALTAGAKTVLIPTDFSDNAKHAAEEALTIVRAFGGRALFLHVLDVRYIYPPVDGAQAVLRSAITPQDLEPDWQYFLHGLPLDGLVWEKQTREGFAAETIAETAAQVGANLVVIGTHGRTGLAHMLLGSVAEKVVRAASCAVLTIRPRAFHFDLP